MLNADLAQPASRARRRVLGSLPKGVEEVW